MTEINNNLEEEYMYIPEALFEMRLKPYEYHVCCRIIYKTKNGECACKEKQEEMSIVLNMSTRHIRNCLKELVKKNIIRIEKKEGQNFIYLIETNKWKKLEE